MEVPRVLTRIGLTPRGDDSALCAAVHSKGVDQFGGALSGLLFTGNRHNANDRSAGLAMESARTVQINEAQNVAEHRPQRYCPRDCHDAADPPTGPKAANREVRSIHADEYVDC